MTTKNYLGNANLKAINVQIQFSKIQVDEYLKCAEDVIYFIETYWAYPNAIFHPHNEFIVCKYDI